MAGMPKDRIFMGPMQSFRFPIVQFLASINALSLSQHETALLIF
jgi:hypothetical protein